MYNYNTDTWTEAASTEPFEFNHFQATEYQGLIWVIGSFIDNEFPDETPADNIFIYNPLTDTWTEGPVIPVARRRGSAGLVLHNEKFYVIAGNTIGHNGGYIPWFDEFDPLTGVWTPLADAPHSRDHFHSAVIGNKLYAVGGRLSGGTGGTFAPLIPEVDVYDFANPGWTTLAVGSNLPTPRAASSTVNFQGKLVVIGGEGNGQAYVNTDALDVSTGNWTALDDLNNARHGTQAIVSGDGIWISSGSPVQGGGTQNNMEYYGTDNPTGTPLVAGTLSAPAALTVPIGGVETFTINNTGGNQGIFITSLALSGADAGSFSIQTSPLFVVPSGQGSTIQIAHTGALPDEVATLEITDDTGTVTNVALTSGLTTDILYRVNAGGPLTAATDAPNPDWTGDEGTFPNAANSPYLVNSSENGLYNQGAASAHPGPINMSHPSLPPGTPSTLFQTERFDATGAPEMTWAFDVDPGTDVEIRLYFAEIFGDITAAGQRVFDVSAEGVVPPAFDDIDPFGTAGALGAIMVSHVITVNDGTLDLVFVHGTENPALKAIEIIDVTGTTPNTAPVVTNPGTQQTVEGDNINLQILASDVDPCTGLTYSATGLPPTLSIDPATGLITGVLDEGTGSGTPGAFIESNGLVIMETETDFIDTAGGFDLQPGTPTYVTASSNHSGDLNGQTLTYYVEISTPGVYRFHLKSAITGNSISDANDTWFKIDNTSDVHFFCSDGGILNSTQHFLNVLAGTDTSRTFYYPVGNAQGRPTFTGSSPGIGGFFKVYKNSLPNSWYAATIDNAPKFIYAYFPNAGTFPIQMSERSAGHRLDRFALAHIDDVSTGVPTATLDGPESQQTLGGTPGASDNSPYNVSVTVADQCIPALSTVVDFTWNVTATPVGNPAALVTVTPGSPLTASTFGDNSFLITNTGDDNIVNVSLNSSTGFMRDVVFDPVGTAGDSTAKCLTEGTNSVGNVGITVPANGGSGSDPDCTTVFAQPHNGVDNQEGFDVLTLDFTDFEPGEAFNFGVDMDPTSIKEDQTSGDAGAISGMELIGTTVTIQFASGVTYTTSLFDEGSLGGSDAIVDGVSNALVAPAIMVDGSTLSRVVTLANQTVQITGQPNSFVTLVRVDGRLHIDNGNPGAGYDIDLFEANEAMAKELYTIQLDGSGNGSVPVVLTQTPGVPPAPDGGINHFIAVTDGPGGENSLASNVIVLEFDQNAVIGPSALVEITPGGGLGASTFGASSFQITNTSTGAVQITSVVINLETGILPDMVFDPTGAGGDATASPFTPNTGAATVGLIAPANPAVDPFSQPRNGGFDIITVNFSDFDPAEYFDFTTDIDPNSIQGVAGAGNAGAVSGYELIGATVTVSFSDGSVLTSSLYEDGSLGGGQAVVAENAPVTPSISVVGVGTGPATVNTLNQVVTVSGTPGDNVSLLLMDSRLFIASGDPPFNVADPTYYANEAMSGKTLFTDVIGPGGTIDIPVTLLQTLSGDATPDGGLNQLIAVSSAAPYVVDQQVSQTSNAITLLYDPNAVIDADITITYDLQGRTDLTMDLTVDVYEPGNAIPVFQFTPTGSDIGEAIVTGITPGTYDIAVKSANYLQKVTNVILVAGANVMDSGQLRAGDANNDNFVTALDFSILAGTFNLPSTDPGFDARADFNGDGFITALDFSLLASNFNTGGDPDPAP
ncbi:MAG TPA: dockerin type I domain-containing protein [Eudoraea sp.]|nr:dockerin type I domain-containing protein [Eudoraea sp.]